MGERPSRSQLEAQLADRCDEVSRLRGELERALLERDQWREIARQQLMRNVELSQVTVIVTPPAEPRSVMIREAQQRALGRSGVPHRLDERR